MHKLIFVNSNFSNVEFSDTSSVPKTLFILYLGVVEGAKPYRKILNAAQTCRGDHNVFEENLRLAKWSSAQNTMIP